MILRASLVGAALLFLFSCGGATPCKTACDCPVMNAPIKCPGEWGCSSAGSCEYSCKNTCDSAGVSTCRVDEECNGSICSARTACK